MKYDFGGYATKFGVKCTDGRTIEHGAFDDCNGVRVPLVWAHLRDDPANIVGYADLECRPDGVYAYCNFNGTEKARTSKELVEHGDITALSIYANHLKQSGGNVRHGVIREVSLVTAGANREALIDNIAISHADGSVTELGDEAVIFMGTDEFEHSVDYDLMEDEEPSEEETEEEEDDTEDEQTDEEENEDTGDVSHADSDDTEKAKTVKEVFDSLTEDQKVLFYAMIGQALEQGKNESANAKSSEDKAEHADESEDSIEHAVGYADIKTTIRNANEEAGFMIADSDKPLFSGKITVYKYNRDGKLLEKKSSEDASELEPFVARIFYDAKKEGAITKAMKDVRSRKKAGELKSLNAVVKRLKSGALSHSDETQEDVEHAALGRGKKIENVAKAATAAASFKSKGDKKSDSEQPTSAKDIEMAKSLVNTLNKIVGSNRFQVTIINGVAWVQDTKPPRKTYKYGSSEWNDVFNSIYNSAKHSDTDKAETSATHSEIEEGGTIMKKNVFEGQDTAPSLSHADRVSLFKEVQSYANDNNITLRKAVEDYTESFLEHGITDIESLFPDYKSLNNPPAWIGAPEAWVNTVWNGTTKTPFARIKSAFADITKDEARARGYIKGKKKEEEQFSLLRRTTDPQTVYKLQKLDRDDIIDITDFDVVAWLKSEMRMKLQEELSRAILIGDGRSSSAEQKIQENRIRPILTDDVFYTLKYKVDMTSANDSTDRANAIIDGAAYAMIDYKGSGGLTAFISPQVLADLRVAKDKNGRRLYTSTSEIASALGVSNIVEVPLMKDLTRTTSTTIGDAESDKTMKTLGILVNLRDYTIGADRGGQTTMFDDFDIDYNKYTYLIETRCSGALIRPASAIVLETEAVGG